MMQLNEIVQAFSEPLAHDALTARCNYWLERISRTGSKENFEHSIWLCENEDYLEEWRVYQAGVLEMVSGQTTMEGQIRKIREVILSGMEIAANASLFAGEIFATDEKHALKSRIDPGANDEEFLQLQKQGLIFAKASVDCMKCIACEFGDAGMPAWSDYFDARYAIFAEKLLRAMLADSSLSIDRLQGTPLEQERFLMDSLKVAILKGSETEFEQARQILESGGRN